MFYLYLQIGFPFSFPIWTACMTAVSNICGCIFVSPILGRIMLPPASFDFLTFSFSFVSSMADVATPFFFLLFVVRLLLPCADDKSVRGSVSGRFDMCFLLKLEACLLKLRSCALSSLALPMGRSVRLRMSDFIFFNPFRFSIVFTFHLSPFVFCIPLFLIYFSRTRTSFSKGTLTSLYSVFPCLVRPGPAHWRQLMRENNRG